MLFNDMTNKDDICIHLGDDYDQHFGAVVPPLFQNSLFVRPKTMGIEAPNAGKSFYYTRIANPTIDLAERKIAALEGSEEARCFSSGMAAISAAVMNCVEKGSHVVAMNNIYGGTRQLLADYLPRFGIETTFVAGTSMEAFEETIRPETRLIYVESPSYLYFELIDIPALAEIAQSKGIRTILDNTWSTPIYQNPLKMGIDMVVHSASKYLGGHSDIVAGAAVASREILDSMTVNERTLLGGSMDPHQAWLLVRGMRTLPVRMRQHQEGAMRIARFLENHDKVTKVMYPGLESHPGHSLAKRQMTGFSGLLSFVVRAGSSHVERFVTSLNCFESGPSWGGYESLIISFGEYLEIGQGHNGEMTLIRISVGLESPESLLEDLEKGLDAL